MLRTTRLVISRQRLSLAPVAAKRFASGPSMDPCPSLKADTHDENGKPYEVDGKKYVVPKIVFSLEWLIESPPPAHTWEEPPIFYDIEGEDNH